MNIKKMASLVPKLQLGNSVREALAFRFAKLELRFLGSQAGAWELAQLFTSKYLLELPSEEELRLELERERRLVQQQLENGNGQ